MKDGPVHVGILGSQFQADCHAAAMSMVEDDMSVVAVASPTAAHSQGLADRYKQATGEDGKVVLKTIFAAYASAGLGRKVSLPYQPTAERPVEEWLNWRKA